MSEVRADDMRVEDLIDTIAALPAQERADLFARLRAHPQLGPEVRCAYSAQRRTAGRGKRRLPSEVGLWPRRRVWQSTVRAWSWSAMRRQ